MRRLKLWALSAVVAPLLAFSSSARATSYKVLYNFGLGQDGAGPESGVVFDPQNNAFGVTIGGGTFGNGTVYELTYSPDTGWMEATLHSFDYKVDGEDPDGRPVFDSSGNLYGTTPFSRASAGDRL